MILKRRKSSTIRTYSRLLFTLSVADIVASCANFVGPAAVPASIPIAGAKGNTTTCNIQAFAIHWGYGTAHWYNTALLFYFTLTVVYELKEGTIAARVEPFMHTFAILFPFGCAVTALLLDSFNPFFGGVNGCWIDSFPPGCLNSNSFFTCTRGEHAHILVMAFTLCPAYFMTIVLYVSTYLIYQAVKQRAHLTHQATFRGSTGALELSSTASMIMLQSAKTKAMMFATAFFATYVFGMVLGTIDWFGKMGKFEKHWPLFLVVIFLTPFQGFLNFVVYIHPRFMRIRRMRKEKTFFWVLWKAIILDTIVPQPVKPSTRNRTLPGSSQTEIADRMLSYHVITRNEVKQASEDLIVNEEAGKSKHVGQDNC